MDFEGLALFIRYKMNMTHIYQPLMIKTLLESGDTATTEQIARNFLSNSVTELEYYKKITGRWPRRTLKKHGIISYKRDRYTLLLDQGVTDEQRQSLIDLCMTRLEEFIEKDPWIRTARNIDAKSISSSLRYGAIAKSGGRCVACGVDCFRRPLDIDHILPRSMGGRTEADNLQALCIRCNRAKRNRDSIDYLKIKKQMQFRRADCTLCSPGQESASNALAYAIFDGRRTDRALVVPKRHVSNISEMILPERSMCFDLAYEIQSVIKQGDGSIARFHTSFESDYADDHYCISVVPIRQ